MNKLFLAILLIFVACQVYSQSTSKNNKPKGERIFLDTINMSEYHFFIDVKKVKQIAAGSGFDSLNGAAAYITTKHPGDYHFLTLEDIKNKHHLPKNAPTVFRIDESYLKDELSKYLIDSSYILNIEVTKLNDFKNIKKPFSALTIIHIKTKTKQNIEASKINEID